MEHTAKKSTRNCQNMCRLWRRRQRKQWFSMHVHYRQKSVSQSVISGNKPQSGNKHENTQFSGSRWGMSTREQTTRRHLIKNGLCVHWGSETAAAVEGLEGHLINTDFCTKLLERTGQCDKCINNSSIYEQAHVPGCHW